MPLRPIAAFVLLSLGIPLKRDFSAACRYGRMF